MHRRTSANWDPSSSQPRGQQLQTISKKPATKLLSFVKLWLITKGPDKISLYSSIVNKIVNQKYRKQCNIYKSNIDFWICEQQPAGVVESLQKSVRLLSPCQAATATLLYRDRSPYEGQSSYLSYHAFIMKPLLAKLDEFNYHPMGLQSFHQSTRQSYAIIMLQLH